MQSGVNIHDIIEVVMNNHRISAREEFAIQYNGLMQNQPDKMNDFSVDREPNVVSQTRNEHPILEKGTQPFLYQFHPKGIK